MSVVQSLDLVTNGDQGKGQTSMENALTAHPDINLVWTVNEPADISRMIGMGVDGMASDYPDRVLAQLK